MALKLFKKLFGKDFEEVDINAVQAITTEAAVHELAYQICVQRIAKALSKCEFRVYERHQENKSDLYYLLNVKPNPQQTAAEFWTDFVQRLYYKREVLIVPIGEYVYLADSYSMDDSKALRAWKFSDVVVNKKGLNRTFTTEDAFYFRLKDGKVKALLDKTTALYSELVKAATAAYRKDTAFKFKLKIARTAEGKPDFEKRLQEILQKDLKAFMGSENAVYPAYDGYDLENVGAGSSGATTRDITALLDDVLHLTCKAFLMPVNICTGEVTDTSKAVTDFLTFCLGPLVTQIEQGLNRVQFTKEDYLNGDQIRIVTSSVKHVDILDASTAIDKLVGCGVQSINDILRILREEPIPEEWADKHFITKNYSAMDGSDSPVSELPDQGKEDP